MYITIRSKKRYELVDIRTPVAFWCFVLGKNVSDDICTEDFLQPTSDKIVFSLSFR
jgi:hypothetical protein